MRRIRIYVIVTTIFVLWMIMTISMSSSKNLSENDKLQSLQQQLKEEIDTEKKNINTTISWATSEINIATIKINTLTECINLNKEILKSNESMTVNWFINWNKIGKAVDCKTVTISNTNWTSTGSIVPVPSWLIAPSQLFLTAKLTDKCFASQTPEQHYKANKRLAWDVVCNFWWEKIWQFQLYAPDYNWDVQEYTVSDIYTSPDTGNTIDLTFWNKRWTIWHVTSKLKKGDVLKTWQIIWQTDLSWITTWHHSHIELWIEWRNVAYDTYSKTLDTYRKNKVPYWWGSTYYFTAYNLWDVKQNDDTPCIGASWKDLCYLEKIWVKTIALTKDVREYLGLKFWDKVKLEWPCWWIYQIEDDMNCRFRWKPCMYKIWWVRKYHPTWNILRPNTQYYIKWDIPSCWWWAHKILKP